MEALTNKKLQFLEVKTKEKINKQKKKKNTV